MRYMKYMFIVSKIATPSNISQAVVKLKMTAVKLKLRTRKLQLPTKPQEMDVFFVL